MPVGLIKLCTKGHLSMRRPWRAISCPKRRCRSPHSTTEPSLPTRLHRKVCLNPRMRLLAPLPPPPVAMDWHRRRVFRNATTHRATSALQRRRLPHGRSHLQRARPDWLLVGRPHGCEPALGTPASSCFPNLAINHSAAQKTTHSSR
jgi:hypothetical protein